MIQISGHTTLTGLLGSPVSHSISPAMHNEAFRQLGIDCVYLAFDVNVENMPSAVEAFRTLNVRGFNVTMPGKNIMASLCDELSPAASFTGSVNTVVNENGRLIGHNTDGIGYMRSVKDVGLDIVGKKMTILGTGATATSIFVQAALDGCSEISIFGREGQSYEHTKKRVNELNQSTKCKLSLYDISDKDVLKQEISQSVLLTNATSVGMAPNTENSVIEDSNIFHSSLVVSDVIYNPRETKLLTLAKSAGCTTFNGLYMLLYQGAAAFELWTGLEMPVDIIKKKYFSE